MILAYPPSRAPFSPFLFSSPLLRSGLQERAFIRVTRARVGTHRQTENTEDSKVSHQIRVGKSSWQVRERVSVLLFIYCLQGQSDNARNTGYICMSGAAAEWRSSLSLCVLSGQGRRWIRGGQRAGRDRSIARTR